MPDDLSPLELEKSSDEIYNYVRDIMGLTPAEAVTILGNTIAKIISKQSKTEKDMVEVYAIAMRHILTMIQIYSKI